MDCHPESPLFRKLTAAALLLFGLYGLVYLGVAVWRAGTEPVGDFFALWSAARFIASQPATQVYDPEALHAFQVGLGLEPQYTYPFPYPPSFLLVLAPLGWLPCAMAYAVAIGGSLVLYLWATAGRCRPSAASVAALLAPTTAITIVAGQSGFLQAALLAGGFRLAASRPLVVGVLFGLLTYKPQLGLLVPVALIAAGLWRTAASACLTVLLLVAGAALVFGPGIWQSWAANLIAYSHQFAAESGWIAHLMPTVSEGLRLLGLGPHAAVIGQIAAAIAAAAIVWRCFRRGVTPLAAAALFVASFLATPHAFVYDMPIVATAVIWVVQEGRDNGVPFRWVELLVLFMAMLTPITMPAGPASFPVVTVSLILLLAVIVVRHARVQRIRPAPDYSGLASPKSAITAA